MPKLYVVGVTEDRNGLVLATSRRAKRGESVLEVDHDLLDAIAEIRRYRAGGAVTPSVSSPALPSRRTTAGEVSSPSQLSPREIQARLRRGESIPSVARRAGVEEWRIEVYAAPIAAEQARIVSKAREVVMSKRGAGPSGRPLGESVQANLVEKNVGMNVDEFESAWSAFEPEPDQWVVRFQYVSRGHQQMAEWMYDPDEETVTPGNRIATTLGWRDPRRTGRLQPLPDAPKESPPARRSSTSKPAAKKSTAQRSATKRSTAKKPAPPRKSTAKKPALKKPAPKKPASKKPPQRRASGRRSSSSGSKSRSKPTKKSPPGPAERAARSRHLRVVDPPPDIEEEGVPESSGLGWREELARLRAADVGDRRSWREEMTDADALDPPSWLQGGERSGDDDPKKSREDDTKKSREDDSKITRLPPPAPRSAGGVSVDAARVGQRPRGERRRRRPLRAR